jgi:DNA-binding response OmpR family regulator
MYHILVCDDDKDIVEALTIYLTAEGYQVFPAYTGAEALEVLEQQEIQLILMDIMMPKMNGIQATARIRETSNVPILFLTAKGEDTDKILGLNIGADDYITKPFNPLELMARVKSQLRRYTRLGGERPSVPPANELEVGNIALNVESKMVTVDGEAVTLTPLEYNILLFFMKHPNQVFSVAQIYEGVWKENAAYGSESTVPVHIRHIREKIEINPAHPRYLKVVWGLGYKLEKP